MSIANYYESFNQAISFYQNEKYQQATKKFKQAIKNYPIGYAALLNLGKLENDKRNYQTALIYCTMSIHIKPYNSCGYYNRAIIYIYLKQYQNTLTNINSALSCLMLRKFILQQKKNNIQTLNQAIKLAPNNLEALTIRMITNRFINANQMIIKQDKKTIEKLSKVYQWQLGGRTRQITYCAQQHPFFELNGLKQQNITTYELIRQIQQKKMIYKQLLLECSFKKQKQEQNNSFDNEQNLLYQNNNNINNNNINNNSILQTPCNILENQSINKFLKRQDNNRTITEFLSNYQFNIKQFNQNKIIKSNIKQMNKQQQILLNKINQNNKFNSKKAQSRMTQGSNCKKKYEIRKSLATGFNKENNLNISKIINKNDKKNNNISNSTIHYSNHSNHHSCLKCLRQNQKKKIPQNGIKIQIKSTQIVNLQTNKSIYPYCVVKFNEKSYESNVDMCGGRLPNWNEMIFVEWDYSDKSDLIFELWSKERANRDYCISQNHLPLSIGNSKLKLKNGHKFVGFMNLTITKI